MAESELTIVEVTGTRRRRLALRGTGLPHMGAEWGSVLNVKTTWYDGNPRASQQVLGPAEMPSAWQGTWRRTLMGRAPSGYSEGGGVEEALVSPDRAWAALEGIQRAGHLLRVTWSAARPWDGSLVQVMREGRIRDLKVQVERVGDLGWSATFEWLGRGESAPNVEDASVAAIDDMGADALESRLNSMVSDYEKARVAAAGGLARAATTITLGKLEQLARAPDAAARQLFQRLSTVTSGLRRAADLAALARAQPASVRARAVDFARDAQAVVRQYRQEQGRTPVEEAVEDTRVSALLEANRRFDGVAEQAADLAAAARANQARYSAPSGAGTGGERSSRGGAPPRALDVVAIHVVADGDTAVSISRRYYRTPDHSDDVLKANGLPWHQVDLPVGAALLIPALAAPASG